MPGVIRLAAVAAVVAACGGAAPATTVDPKIAIAQEYAMAADRALDGTAFESVSIETLADSILALCAGTDHPARGLVGAIAELEVPHSIPSDEAIAVEVLITGVSEVCPERLSPADPGDAYLGLLTAAVLSAGGEVLDDDVAITAGLAACDALDLGDPGDAMVAVAAVGFGVETDLAGVFAGVLGPAGSATTGAIVTTAAQTLCPEHMDRVVEFIANLAA